MWYVCSKLLGVSFTFFLFFATQALAARSAPTPAVLRISEAPSSSFGAVSVGSSVDKTFTVENSGEATARQISFGITGPFSRTGGNCGQSLNGEGRTCRIKMTFSPTTGGAATGTITIQYFNGTSMQNASITLTGTGTTPAVLTMSPSPYDYGNVRAGTSKTRTFTLTNSGQTGAVRISTSISGSRFSFAGGYPGIGGNCGTSLSGNNANCSFILTFSPLSARTSSGTLTLKYFNGVNYQTLTLSLSGKGTSSSSSSVSSISPKVGPINGGTALTINGSGFSTGDTVKIGGTSCNSVVRVSSSQITCVTPAHAAGTYDVVVAGTETLINAFTYLAAPTLTSVSPSVGLNSVGTPIEIIGTQFRTGVTVTLGGSACQNIQLVTENVLQCTTPVLPTGTVSLTVRNSDGQSATLNNAFTSQGAWTWVDGTSLVDQGGSTTPSGRDSATYWTDSSSGFWLFGGWGVDGNGSVGAMNDFWKYSQGTWTRLSGSTVIGQQGIYGTKGVADASNYPGSRINGLSWRDSQNNLWLFGGFGYDSIKANGHMNDLWKFDGTQWTWMAGSNLRNQKGIYGTQGVPDAANMPGVRILSATWIDSSDNLWLFGGFGMDSAGARGDLNDLWVFDGAMWTWMGGSTLRLQPGNWGTQGLVAASNIPSSRRSAQVWQDSSNNFWLFGGAGRDSAGVVGPLNDLWKFDGTQWTWVAGSNLANQVGVYGTQGTAAASNAPGARDSGVTWTDAANNFWFFGGRGIDAQGFLGQQNELWKFNGTQWTWISGGQQSDVPGIYGTKGAASPSNIPGSRQYSSAWMDSNGYLWLFGGFGFDSNGATGEMNDLWMYRP